MDSVCVPAWAAGSAVCGVAVSAVNSREREEAINWAQRAVMHSERVAELKRDCLDGVMSVETLGANVLALNTQPLGLADTCCARLRTISEETRISIQ